MQLESSKMLKKDPSLKRVVFLVLICIFGIVTFLAMIPWQQTVDGYGEVTTRSPSDRQQNISAPIGGRLGKWYVVEGDFVKKGDPIVEVLDLDPEVVSRLEEEKEAIELGIKSIKLAIENTKKNIKRHEYLVEKGASTQRIYEQAQMEMVNYTKDLANANVDLAKIKVQIARQKSRLVVAPADGVIVDRMHGLGGVIVKETDTLATIVPNSTSRIVQLWVNSMDIPLISIGDKVMLQFEGWPAIQFSGWPQVAIGTFEGEVIFISPQDNFHGQFKVFIKQSGKRDWPSPNVLRLGTKVHGWVLLGDVSLGYELWRRYNGFPINLNSSELYINMYEEQETKKYKEITSYT
ncbi:CusB/HlyD membrane fusion family barrel-sandwich protein [Allofrancisella inopinata]|uniref:HlyD family efflux transporter periplasmic adaptor subunit n=1 Tax=Allofrancisella inopinata TaxID=1085647 RepID=A0AAE7CQ24_9GAMM|nr:HlyD family efflux transporter periplasmic adaptor subunit [Allofrancisella inopinata]QIV95415.1 HlyD family efflux transporter periplasmic adaptor subunit [Allofrancisella inopinata]TDT69257.1 CusB/HlyD membrane fusion family barrel-sandwich protein [Allofrancisella inopinata]